jgi:hypothetical protein
MIKRHDIRPRRKRNENGTSELPNGGEPVPAVEAVRPGPTPVGPLTPAGAFDDK